ncbi:hypothetical protein [Bifidobacterium cuniculi]|uniref:Uncharacterized protein n=1 Tax=Bifidobacterium cuniculi TaxID=1688 RepID=A0A087AYN9_9BIFI|nr:hypothetical protein [Bifidobacterium cuniculi]KFI63889.1 hypothetical protein BCUN_1501 [Bifidobacterium cuniculi]
MTNTARPRAMRQYRELSAMLAFLNDEWDLSGEFGGPTFLWDDSIGECSAHDDETRADLPVAPAEQAKTVIGTPMQWYFESLAASVPGAVREADHVDIPRNLMPTFRLDTQALAGVDAVVANAMASNRWLDGVRNLTTAVRLTAQFISSCMDRDQEALDYLKELIQNVRIYMDSVARNADPATSALALRIVTETACLEDFRFNPMPMVELLACTLSFVRWDDTRVLAYDALNHATRVMDGMVAGYGDAVEMDERFHELFGIYADQFDDLSDSSDFDDYEDALSFPGDERELQLQAHHQFTQAVELLRHDLLRMGGDDDAADELLLRHADQAPLADTYAARLLQAGRFEDLLAFTDKVLADTPNRFTIMFPEELVPYEWESLRELALQGLDRRDALREMYRRRIVEASDGTDLRALSNLRRLSGRDWKNQVAQIVEAYQDGKDRMMRNPVYERLLISQGMHEEAVRYLTTFPEALPDLSGI